MGKCKRPLLKEAECTFDDMGQMIVYLRDIADYTIVKEMYDKRFPCTPKVFVHAPVCRPGWLIEMECKGSKKPVKIRNTLPINIIKRYAVEKITYHFIHLSDRITCRSHFHRASIRDRVCRKKYISHNLVLLFVGSYCAP